MLSQNSERYSGSICRTRHPVGMGGADVSLGNIAASMSGLQDTLKIGGAKLASLLGSYEGISTLNAVNMLGYSNNEFNYALGKAVWGRSIKARYSAELKASEGNYGSYNGEDKPDELVFSAELLGNGKEQATKLAAVMAHEGVHAAGNRYEAVAYMQSLTTYQTLAQTFGLQMDKDLTAGSIAMLMEPASWEENRGNTDNLTLKRTADGRYDVYPDGSPDVYLERNSETKQMVGGKGILLYDKTRDAYLIKKHESSMAGANFYSALLPLLKSGQDQESDKDLLNRMARNQPLVAGSDGILGSGDEKGYGLYFTRTQVEQFVAQNLSKTYLNQFSVNRPESSGAAIPSNDEYEAVTVAMTSLTTFSGLMGNPQTNMQKLITIIHSVVTTSLFDEPRFSAAYGMTVGTIGTFTNLGSIAFGLTGNSQLWSLFQGSNMTTNFLQLGTTFPSLFSTGDLRPMLLAAGAIGIDKVIPESLIPMTIYAPISLGRQVPKWAGTAYATVPPVFALGYSFATQDRNPNYNFLQLNYDFSYNSGFSEPSFRRSR